MTHYGVMWMARALAIQYGDGHSINAFWQASQFWYNRLGKVDNYHITK